MRDVLGLPVALLRAMSAATSLELRLAAAPGTRVVLTTSGSAYRSALESGAAAFAPDEYEAVALAVELEVANASDVAAWSRAKLEQPLTITARVAMRGAEGLVPHFERFGEQRVRGKWERTRLGTSPRAGVQQRTTLTFGELLERIDAQLVNVTAHARPAPAPSVSRAREAGGESIASPATSPTETTFADI